MRIFLPLCSLWLVFACSTPEGLVTSAPPTESMDAQPEPMLDAGRFDGKPSFPLAKSLGGKVIAHPKVQPIYFAGDPLIAHSEDFLATLAASSYWGEVTAEYGVGALTVHKGVILNEAAPTRIYTDEVDAKLKSLLEDPTTPVGTADPETNYLLVFPEGTVIVERQSEEESCEAFGGYHFEVTLESGTKVGEAVIPRCTISPNASSKDTLTEVTSHELVEWATDPFPYTDPAYARLDDDHLAWEVFMAYSAEISDLCTALDSDPLTIADLPFRVQRHWSNRLAQQSTFPCSPRSATKLYMSFPDILDRVDGRRLIAGGKSYALVETNGIIVRRGESRTVKVHHYGEDPNQAPWIPYVVGLDEYYPQLPKSEFTYELNTRTAAVGGEAELTITASERATQEVAVMISRTSLDRPNAFVYPFLVTVK